MTTSTKQPPPAPEHGRPRTRYFSATGCVVHYPDRREVFVGGALIASFAPEDRVERNLAIVAVTRDRRVTMTKLGEALGISRETVRAVVRRYESEGIAGLVRQRAKGKPRKLTPKLVQQLGPLFDDGLTIDQAHQRIRRRVSRAVVGRAHKQWSDARKKAEAERLEREREAAAQLPLDAATVTVKRERRAPRSTATPAWESGRNDSATDAASTPGSEELGLECAIDRGGRNVQHLGCWIMLAMLQALGLYSYAEAVRQDAANEWAAKGQRFLRAVTLRVVIDAVVCALTLKQGTVEGVRRMATPSAPTLLRHDRSVSPSWARTVLGRLAAARGELLHLTVATALVQQSEAHAQTEGRAVFYVDNHLRPYSGKHTIRKGWRMQAKRACPGHADYWVHGPDGRPVMRVNSPEHKSLVQWLRPIGEQLRNALEDPACPVLMVFDRAGAFPGEMAALRDAGFEFVTYERKPYAKLPGSAFDCWVEIGDERIEFTETRDKNLKHGRGRVRRIALRMPDGYQVNVLAVSTAPASNLIHYMLTRWAHQENQFKHGIERWGINQLDGRRVEPYPPDAVIPNPARRRIERELRSARAAEGEALRRLAHLTKGDPQCAQPQQKATEARAEQARLEALRAHAPKHAPVRETELAQELVVHRDEYKLVVDALRVALSNAETELAARLAPHLSRPAEAKNTLTNLLSAPGTVTVRKASVLITLSPAGTPREYKAFDELLRQLNELPLTLPGDSERRRLRFRLQKRGDPE